MAVEANDVEWAAMKLELPRHSMISANSTGFLEEQPMLRL